MTAIQIVLYPLLGAGLGAAYFLLLHRAVRLHAAAAPALQVIPAYLARIAGAVLVFWLIAQQGAAPLLLALLGFVVARMVVMRHVAAV